MLHFLATFDGGLDICARTGHIYVAGRGESGGWRIYVLDRRGTKILGAIDGSGSPRGPFEEHAANLAVDQLNCHVVINDYPRAIEEYEPFGAFVDEFGRDLPNIEVDLAVDNTAGSPNRGNVYLSAPDGVSAFGPLAMD